MQPSSHASERSRRRSRQACRSGSVDRWQLTLDGMLLAILAFAPLFFGGRYDGGKFVFVVLVVAAMCVCAFRVAVDRTQRWYGCHALWLVGGGVLLLGLQLWPGSNATSSAERLLPVWSQVGVAQQDESVSATTIGTWGQQSFAPAATRGGMVMLLAYGGLFVVTIQRVREIRDVERTLTLIGWTTVGMAAFGLLQYLTSSGSFLWFYDHPWRDTTSAAKGPFDNQNHFVHYLALGCGPLLWWWLHRANKKDSIRSSLKARSGNRRTADGSHLAVGSLAVGVVMFAALMSFSRAGCLLILLVVAAATFAYFRMGWIRRQLALSLVGVATLVFAALWIHGSDRLTARLSDYAGVSVNSLDRGHVRRQIWAANIEGIRQNGPLGSGVGTHVQLCPVYLKNSASTEHTHAESGYLQVLLETGWYGLLLVLGGISAVVGWIAFGGRRPASPDNRQLRIRGCMVAVATGLTASMLHSFVDFVWYIPACLSFAIILAACAFRLRCLAKEPRIDLTTAANWSPLARWGVVASTVCVGAWMIHDRAGPAIASPAWDSYLRKHNEHQQMVQEDRGESEATADVTGIDSPQEEALDSLIEDLEFVVRWNPNHGRAHLRLAGVYVQKCELIMRDSDNALDLSQLRDTVIRADFATLARRTLTKADRNANGTLERGEADRHDRWLEHWNAADSNADTRLDPVELTGLLRDQWLKQTMRFSIKAAEVVGKFDQDGDQVLSGDELKRARLASQTLSNARPAQADRLFTEEISDAYRKEYAAAHRYLHSAYAHAVQGLSICPLQGEGYLLLAELCFISERANSPEGLVQAKRQMVNQALRLRPWDGGVLLVAGREAALSNHTELAAALWRRSFMSGTVHRSRLIDLFVAHQMPIEFVTSQFAPVLDARSCDQIARRFESSGLPTESRKFWSHFARVAEAEAQRGNQDGASITNSWLLANRAYQRLGDTAAMLRCARAAAKFEPNDFKTRRSLVRNLIDQQLYVEAEPHVRWCLRRKPEDKYLRSAITKILDAESGGLRKTETISKQNVRDDTRRS